MKKKPTPFLDFYQQCLTSNKYFSCICTELPLDLYQNEAFHMVTPTNEERIIHGNTGWGIAFWGRSYNNDPKGAPGFNEFRQTVILLCAAINEEL